MAIHKLGLALEKYLMDQRFPQGYGYICLFDGDPEEGGQLIEMERFSWEYGENELRNRECIKITNGEDEIWNIECVAMMNAEGEIVCAEKRGYILGQEKYIEFPVGSITFGLT